MSSQGEARLGNETIEGITIPRSLAQIELKTLNLELHNRWIDDQLDA